MNRQTMSGELTRDEQRAGRLLAAGIDFVDDSMRPRTRGDCVDGERPCPWIACRHHLAIDVTPSGAVVLPHGHVDLDGLQETCALDVADRGGCSLEEVGELMAVTRERIRQIEVKALLVARRHMQRAGVTREMADGLGTTRGTPLAIAAEQWAPGGGLTLDIGELPIEVQRANLGHREFCLSGNSRWRRSPEEKPREEETAEEHMPVKAKLDTLHGAAAAAVQRALGDHAITARMLSDELTKLGVEIGYGTIWDYLRRRRAAQAKRMPDRAAQRSKPQPEPTPECSEGAEPPAQERVTALVHVPRAVLQAQQSGYVVLPDGTILAPTAKGAVEVAQLLRGGA